MNVTLQFVCGVALRCYGGMATMSTDIKIRSAAPTCLKLHDGTYEVEAIIEDVEAGRVVIVMEDLDIIMDSDVEIGPADSIPLRICTFLQERGRRLLPGARWVIQVKQEESSSAEDYNDW